MSPEDEVVAWEIFTRHPDKGYSYADCTSVALMQRLRLDAAFAYDAHFEQFGQLTRLPRD